MRNFFALVLAASLTFSCKTKNAIDADTLPKDISLKPDHSVLEEHDANMLKSLRLEMEDLIAKTPCDNPENWRISPVGFNACGEPSSYIAYPVESEKEILLKIKKYGEIEKELYKKQSVTTDCAVVPAPSGIKCVDGKAVLTGGSPAVSEAQ